MTAASPLILAAPHPAALAAARRAAGRGGNAVDAALAAAAALTVVYPHQCSLGGDLIALVHAPGGSVRAVISVGAAAQAVDVEALRAADRRMPAQGPQTVTVPGVVAGWAALAETYGTPGALGDALRDAAELAEDGATVSAGLARAIRERAPQIGADPGLTALLTGPDGAPSTRATRCPSPNWPPYYGHSPTIRGPSTEVRSPRRWRTAYAGPGVHSPRAISRLIRQRASSR